jgi:hypothetical protein
LDRSADMRAGRLLTAHFVERIGRLAALPASGRDGQWRDHRQVINAILWKLRTGAPWRDLPERYGPWKPLPSGYVSGPWTRRKQRIPSGHQPVGTPEPTDKRKPSDARSCQSAPRSTPHHMPEPCCYTAPCAHTGNRFDPGSDNTCDSSREPGIPVPIKERKGHIGDTRLDSRNRLRHIQHRGRSHRPGRERCASPCLEPPKHLMPSAVFVESPQDVYAGNAALNKADEHPQGLLPAPKRMLGIGMVPVNGYEVPPSALAGREPNRCFRGTAASQDCPHVVVGDDG